MLLAVLASIGSLDDRSPLVTVVTKQGAVEISRPRRISGEVLDFRMNYDGSAFLYARRVPASGPDGEGIEVVYEDGVSGMEAILVPKTDRDHVASGLRFAFVGKSRILVYAVDPGPWEDTAAVVSGPPFGRSQAFRKASIFRHRPGQRCSEPLGTESVDPGPVPSMSSAEGLERVALLVQSERTGKKALWTVGQEGPAKRFLLHSPGFRIYFHEHQESREWMRFTKSEPRIPGALLWGMNVPRKGGIARTYSTRLSLPAGKPSMSPESLFPDEIPFIPYDPEIFSWPEGSWTYKGQRNIPFWIRDTVVDWTKEDAVIEFDGPKGRERRQLPMRFGNYRWSTSADRLAVLTDGVLSILPVRNVRSARGR